MLPQCKDFTTMATIMNGFGTIPSRTDKATVTLTFAMLNRLLDWAHTQCSNQDDIYKVVENLSSANLAGVIDLDAWNSIVPETEEEVLPKATEEDIEKAEELGKEVADSGINLDNVDYSDVSYLINMQRGDEFGSSNSEIESFWDGYESKEPVYDDMTEDGEPQVNGELANGLENIVASYREGGISGEHCKDSIDNLFDENEKEGQDALRQYQARFNIVPEEPTIDNPVIDDDTLTPEEEEEISKIVFNGKF